MQKKINYKKIKQMWDLPSNAGQKAFRKTFARTTGRNAGIQDNPAKFGTYDHSRLYSLIKFPNSK